MKRWLRELDAGHALFAAAWLCVVFVLLDREHAWVSIEAVGLKREILRDGPALGWRDLAHSLDYMMMEYGPRLTRPLSSLLQIVDTKFRAWLWQWFLPHPALSLTWIFALFLSPLLVVRLLRNLGVSPLTSRLAAALYVASPGFLSAIVLYFRPAKAMTGFSLLLCLAAASELNRKRPPGETPRKPDHLYGHLLLLILVSLLWDETALLIYPSVAIFFPRLIGRGPRLAAYAAVPVLAGIGYFAVLPWLARTAGYAPLSLASWGNLRWGGWVQWWQLVPDYVVIFRLFVTQSLGLVEPWRAASPLTALLAAANAGALVALAVWWYRHRTKLLPWKDAALARRIAVFLLVLLAAHEWLMVLVHHPAAPLLWYGCYWSLIFVLGAALVVDRLPSARWRTALVAVAVVTQLHLYAFANQRFRSLWYDLTPDQRAAEAAATRRRFTWYRLDWKNRPSQTDLTRVYWETWRAGLRPPSPPPELAYLAVECP